MQWIAKLPFITAPADSCYAGDLRWFRCRQGSFSAAGSSPSCEVADGAEPAARLGEPPLSLMGCGGLGCTALAVEKTAGRDNFCPHCCQSVPPASKVRVWHVGYREEAVVT